MMIHDKIKGGVRGPLVTCRFDLEFYPSRFLVRIYPLWAQVLDVIHSESILNPGPDFIHIRFGSAGYIQFDHEPRHEPGVGFNLSPGWYCRCSQGPDFMSFGQVISRVPEKSHFLFCCCCFCFFFT